MNVEMIATASNPTTVALKKPAAWPWLATISPDTEVLSAAPIPETVPTSP